MIFLTALLEAFVFVYFCKGAIKKHPGVFYVLSVAIIAFCACYKIMNLYTVFPEWTYTYIISVFWRGAFATALFVIVMYIGALDRKSKIVKALMPIRGYLSIIACLITLAHSFAYGAYYIPTMINNPQELDLRGIIALIITLPLFTIMIILMVTSFIKVRRKMKPKVWKNVQRLAYPWFALLYIYLMVLFIHTVIESFDPASELSMFYKVNYILSVVIYTLVFVGYFILRIRKYRLDKVRT
ncbi:ferric reductase-like transmembrane domain-containing protein [Lacrimispora sp.]|uniref:ferric reductase-like transmembrane domain-containing protein n=1 Tax=Lacrimispora sp. TaxID=2719234 RepID=UPI0028AA6CA3|nr:ferric reductase-like transmembrane domain-containing protein [Lacrimispora sp.]